MNESEIISRIEQRTAGLLSESDIREIVRSALSEAGPASVSTPNVQPEVLHEFVGDVSDESASDASEPEEKVVGEMPKAFLCQFDFDADKLNINYPLVVLPNGISTLAELPDTLKENDYYCYVVKGKSGGFRAIVHEDESFSKEDGETVVLTVPVCRIYSQNGALAVHQIHVGAIICPREPKDSDRSWTWKDGVWTNAYIQYGYTIRPVENGLQQPSDGQYYAEINVDGETATVFKNESGQVPLDDLDAGKVYVYVGSVSGGKQNDGIYSIPVIYKYL